MVHTPPSSDHRSPEAQRLLDGALDLLLTEGLKDMSMRALASRLGTSHRMLNYHFGSADGFWGALVNAARARQQETIRQAGLAKGLPDLVTFWRAFTSETQLQLGRLMFEIFGKALSDRESHAAFLEGMFQTWLDLLTPRLQQALQCTEAQARAMARLNMAVLRGLLMDLLATGDVAGTRRAVALYTDILQAGLPAALGQPASPA